MENSLKKYWILLAFLGLWIPSIGQSPDTLRLWSLDSAYSLSLKHNSNQAIYLEQIKQAHFNFKAAQSFLYPNISGSFSGQDNLNLATTIVPGELIGKPGTSFNAQFGKKYVYNSGITLQKDLLSWQNALELKLAKGNYILSQVQANSYLQSLKEQVGKLYFSILVAKESLKIGRKDIRIADTLVQISRNKLREGTIDGLVLNQALINQNIVQENFSQSQLLYDQGIENLMILLGEKGDREIKVQENLNLDSLVLAQNISLNPDKSLDIFKQNVLISKTQANLIRSALLPKLSFQTYLGAQQFRNDFGLSLNSNNWTKYSYLGLNLNIPIFTGFNTSNKYRASLIQRNISEIQWESAIKQSKIQDQLLMKTNQDLMESLKSSGGNLILYEKNLHLNQEKFIEGIISLDIYLKAFQDYINAENTHLNNISQYLSNRATIISRQ